MLKTTSKILPWKSAGVQKAGLALLLAAALLLALGWTVIDRSRALAKDEAIALASDDGPHTERDERPGAPAISFIDSAAPACMLVDYQRDLCQIQFAYLYVTATDPQYMISMSVQIDNRIRGYYSGFFQNYIYIPADMNESGFRVRCGQVGSSGNPRMGKSYNYTIRARETGGLRAANYGTVSCPAGPSVIHLPLVRKH